MLEKDDSWDIVDYGNCDISATKNILINMITEENAFIRDHGDKSEGAKVHIIYDFPLDWDGEEVSATASSTNIELVNSVEPIISHLEEFYDGTRAGVLIGKFPPNKELTRYQDANRYLLSIRRNHIPIITNDNVFSSIGPTEINMKESVWYEINNSKEFTIKNNSEFDRYHLVIDILPNSKK